MVEPDLVRDAVIVGVLGLLLLAVGAPLRWTLLILALLIGVTVLVEDFFSGLE